MSAGMPGGMGDGMRGEPRPPFDGLSPDLVIRAVQEAYGIPLDGTMMPYRSYVNRVYGLRADDGREFVAKFYRPARWSREAVLEEHRFVADCAEAELPVVSPIADLAGSTLPEIAADEGGGDGTDDDARDVLAGAGDDDGARYMFALFPKRGGRSFDAESDSDWLRLGALAGRLHAVGARGSAPRRPRLGPELARENMEAVLPLVHPEFRAEFAETCEGVLESVAVIVASLPVRRIHGDLHRGNILERPGEGLLLLDFDDMMTGPPVQDLWLLLPGRAGECGRELSLLVEGYSDFAELAPGSVAAIEALRFYRMLHFLAWRAAQRSDAWFRREMPDWGTRPFWIREVEDLRDQARAIAQA